MQTKSSRSRPMIN